MPLARRPAIADFGRRATYLPTSLLWRPSTLNVMTYLYGDFAGDHELHDCGSAEPKDNKEERVMRDNVNMISDLPLMLRKDLLLVGSAYLCRQPGTYTQPRKPFTLLQSPRIPSVPTSRKSLTPTNFELVAKFKVMAALLAARFPFVSKMIHWSEILS